MYKGYKIAAVVPAHNEAVHIKEVIVTMPDLVDIIAITDDKSSDNTFEIASSTGDTRVFVNRHEVNTGVGGAIITAHSEAIIHGSDINVVFAGDGQIDPHYITKLLDPIIEGFYGFTKGNRLFSSQSHRGMPKYRLFGNYVLSYMHKAVSGYWHINDPQNGYTAIKTDILNEVNYETLSGGYEFENDLLTRLNEYYIPVSDIPIPARYLDEVSGIDLKKVIPALLKNFIVSAVTRIYRKYIKTKKVIPILLSAIVIFATIYTTYQIFSLHILNVVLGVAVVIASLIILFIYDYKSTPKKW